MRKALAILLIALTAVTGLVAGGSSESTNADGTTTLTFAVWDYAQNVYLGKAIEAFEAANPTIKIEVQDTPAADYVTKSDNEHGGIAEIIKNFIEN